MTMPGQSDLHIDQPLTNVAVAWFFDQQADSLTDIFPELPVDKRSDLYRKYGKSEWRKSRAQKRAPGTETVGTGWHVDNDQYFCEVYGVHVDIDDQTRANADSVWNLDRDATRLVTGDLLIQREQLWCANYFQNGVWSTTYTGVASNPTTGQFLQWDQTSSDPLKFMTSIVPPFKLLTGRNISFGVLGVDVWTALANHPAILDRIKYTEKGVVTLDLVAAFFNVPKLKVAWASQATGPEIPDVKNQDANATYSFIANTKAALFGYAPKSASTMEPSAGYTFTWKGYGAQNKQGLTVRTFRQEQLRSTRIEAEASYVQKVIAPDCGIWLASVVS